MAGSPGMLNGRMFRANSNRLSADVVPSLRVGIADVVGVTRTSTSRKIDSSSLWTTALVLNARKY